MRHFVRQHKTWKQEFPGGLVVKDSTLSLLWLGHFDMPRAQPKNKQTNKKKTEKHYFSGAMARGETNLFNKLT